MKQKVMRGSAVAGAMAGLLVVAGGFLPFPSMGRAVSLCFSGILILLFLIGHYTRQQTAMGTMGKIGCVALGSGLLLLVIRTALWAALGPNLFGFLTAGLSLVLFAWGVILYGTVSLEAGIFPSGATLLWMIGLVQIPLLVNWMPARILAGAGMIWSSRSLWAADRTKPPVMTMAVQNKRLVALDALGGLMMVLMAIDHAGLIILKRHPLELWDMPLPAYAGAAEFLTRFVTHLWAPGFFFLAGAWQAFFVRASMESGWSKGRIAQHFILKGLLLIALEQFLLNPLTTGRLIPTQFGALSGLGGVLILGALIVHLNKSSLAVVGSGLILLTQALPSALEALEIEFTPIIRLLLVPGSSGNWFALYPLIPWLGMAAMGVSFGYALQDDRNKAFRLALIAGVTCLLLFPAVRMFGSFGNFKPREGPGWIAFLSVAKYPPSLSFTLLTMGINLILLNLFVRAREGLQRWAEPLITFGRTALYFYMTHWFIYVAIGWFFRKAGGLWLTYMGWWMGLVLLYPICKFYSGFKNRMGVDSPWRLL